jgi:hypothetical protein
MRRRFLAYLAVVTVVACNPESTTRPPAPPSTANPVISDGAHGAGNPDFFFLAGPLPNPSRDPDYGDPFNGNLLPLVSICELDPVAPGGDAQVLPDTPCKSGGYSQNIQTTSANVDLVGEKYQVGWTVPIAAAVYYRVFVKIGLTTLGSADVKTAASARDLREADNDNFITRTDGADLPIKFRIEEFALCDTPGTGPCASESVNLTAGGTVSTTFAGDDAPSGVEIPPGSGAGTTTITIEECLDLNPRATDLPVYGKCGRVTADPPLTVPLAQAAVVFICNAVDDVGTSLGATQRSRVTLHRFDESQGAGDPDSLTALPHVDPAACEAPPPSFGLGHSLKGILADLRHGRFKSAGGRLAGMLSPKPLYATLLDEGGGGLSFIFSDFQFALPAKMEKVASTDNQFALPGVLPNNPKVIVTDLAGVPVGNARVRFGGTTEAACLALPVGSGVLSSSTDGSASAAWTIVQGANTRVACGRGIADADESSNGPRTGAGAFDPFQPIQTPFDAADPVGGPVPEPVLNGSVTFTATGVVLFGVSPSGAGRSGAGQIEPNPGSLFSINPLSGLASLIGSSGVLSPSSVVELSTIEFDPTTGTLYGIAGSTCGGAILVTINPNTGAGTAIGPLVGAGFNGSQPGGSPSPCTGGSDALAIAADGTMYASGWNGGFTGPSFLRIDKSTGQVLSAVASNAHMAGFTFDASGTLWASGGITSPNSIQRMSPTTGQIISSLQLKTAAGANEFVVISALARAGTGTLFASLPQENQLAIINTTTGVLTRVGNYGALVTRISGLASAPTPP